MRKLLKLLLIPAFALILMSVGANHVCNSDKVTNCSGKVKDVTIQIGGSYSPSGGTEGKDCCSDCGGNVTNHTITYDDSEVDTSTPGTYTVTATCDKSCTGISDGTVTVEDIAINATFTAKAAGNRTVNDGETLVFADDGKSRSVTFTVDTNDTFLSDYPTWTGVNGTKGSLSTTESVTSDKSISVSLDTLRTEVGADVSFENNLKGTFSLDFSKGSKGQAVIQKVEYILNKLGGHGKFDVGDSKVMVEYEKVDKYSDGTSLGYKVSGEGSVAATLGKSEFSYPHEDFPAIPIGTTGATIRAKVAFSALTLKATGSGTYDESKSNTGSVTATLEGSTDMSAGADIEAFLVAKLELRISGKFFAKLELDTNSRGSTLKGEAGSSALDATATLNIGVLVNTRVSNLDSL